MATTAAEASAGQVTPKLIFGRFRFWLFMVGLVVILTGLLFGYDQGVISGALQFIAKDFHLSTTLQEVVTSWVTLGALVASFLSIMNAIGAGATFLMFAVLCVIAFFWVRVKVPETKGKSLEQIQQAWAEHDKARQAPKKPTYSTD